MFGKEDKKEEKKPVDKAVEKAEKKVTKKAPAKTSSSSDKIAKSAFYFGGKHFKTGDVVDLGKEDLSFLEEKGKLK